MNMSRYDKGQAKEIKTTKVGKPFSGFVIDVDSAGKYHGGKELDSAGNITSFYTDMEEDENGGVTTGIRHKADSSYMGTFYNVYTDGMQTGSS